jgi:hypothetical protein
MHNFIVHKLFKYIVFNVTGILYVEQERENKHFSAFLFFLPACRLGDAKCAKVAYELVWDSNTWHLAKGLQYLCTVTHLHSLWKCFKQTALMIVTV